MDRLGERERAAANQLHNITNGDLASEIAMLESVDWNVQRAVDAIFDTDTIPPQNTPLAQPPRIEQMEVDDSLQRQTPLPSSTSRHPITRLVRRIILSPFSFLYTLGLFTWRLLRSPLRLGFAPSTFNLNWQYITSIWAPSKRESPGTQTERWVRELETEVGAVDTAQRSIPEFYLGSYNDALMVAKREFRVMMVILLSDAHDDTPKFKRETLTDRNLLNLLSSSNVLVWGGDVRYPDVYSASLKLGATTYPFIAFIALQPSRLPVSRSSTSSAAANGTTSTHLSVVSRLTPSQCTATGICAHITTTILPRVETFLERLRSDESRKVFQRTQDRLEREAADRRIQASAAADSERIFRRREEERKRQVAEQESMQAEIRKTSMQIARRTFWASAANFFTQPQPLGVQSLRFTLHLPSGQRMIRHFSPQDTLTSLYAFAATSLHTSLPPPPVSELPQSEHDLYNVYQDGWGFQLLNAYPRAALPWTLKTQNGVAESISDACGGLLRNGGLIMVEIDQDSIKFNKNSSTSISDEDDEYLSDDE